jgi:hypothetical protein
VYTILDVSWAQSGSGQSTEAVRIANVDIETQRPTFASSKMDYFGDSSDYDSNLDSDYVTESDSATDYSDMTSHTSNTSLSPIDGIGDDDDQSLHTNDTDVESWYEDESISGDSSQNLDDSSVDAASTPVLKVLADSQPDRKEPWFHCQACDNPDFVGIIQCCGSMHEGVGGYFHYACVGLDWEPPFRDYGDWFCSVCRPRSEFAPVAGRPSTGGKGISLLKVPWPQPLRPALPLESGDTSKTQSKPTRKTPKKARWAELSFPNTDLSKADVYVESILDRVKRKRRPVESADCIVVSSTVIEPVKRQDLATVSEDGNSTDAASTLATATTMKQRITPSVQSKTSTQTILKVTDHKKVEKLKWKNPTESQGLADLMKAMLESSDPEDVKVKGTDHKWQLLADRLRKIYGYERTANSVKNYWQRKGRATFSIDERIVAKPEKLVTSVQNPEDRKKRRDANKKSKGLSSNTDNNGHFREQSPKRKRDSSDSSGDDEPLIIRRRPSPL